MADPEAPGQLVAFPGCKQGQLTFHEPQEIAFEILQKQLVILARQQPQNIVIISLQMLD